MGSFDYEAIDISLCKKAAGFWGPVLRCLFFVRVTAAPKAWLDSRGPGLEPARHCPAPTPVLYCSAHTRSSQAARQD